MSDIEPFPCRPTAAAGVVNGSARKPAASKPPKPSAFSGGGDSDEEDADFEAKCVVYMR